MDDVLVIGGGPAGAACALWGHQLGLRVRLFEGGPALGGLQRRSPYANRWLPGLQGLTGQQIAASLESHLDACAVPYRLDFHARHIERDPHRDLWRVSDGATTHVARHVVIATGSRPRHGGFEPSERIVIGPGLPMEQLDVRQRRVAILGGGDNAFDQAAFVMGRGAIGVDLYCRTTPRAQPLLQRHVDPAHVHVGPFDVDAAALTVNGTPYDFIGVQFGFEACVPGGLRLPRSNGYIRTNRRGAVPGFSGLFAAGEVTNYWHPCVVTSYAHGVQVAKAIQAGLMSAESAPGPGRRPGRRTDAVERPSRLLPTPPAGRLPAKSTGGTEGQKGRGSGPRPAASRSISRPSRGS